ncbi:MAG: XrtB/PEP-CTERM-associated polysaccharide biosynthesis outer membrane protein EpsL [Pseudomonadota bacterium]
MIKIKFFTRVVPILIIGCSLAIFNPLYAATDSFDVILNQTFMSDDNLYRLPDDISPAGSDGETVSRSDRIQSTSLGLHFDQIYSLQGLRAELDFIRNAYQKSQQLDFTAKNALAAWDWQLGNRFSGEVSAFQTESLRGFADRASTIQSINTMRRFEADGDWWFHPRWSVGGMVGTVSSRNSDEESNLAEYDQDILETWISYRTFTPNVLSLVFGNIDQEYPNRVADPLLPSRFQQNYVRLRGDMQVTGQSFLSGFIGQTQRDYPDLEEKDFSGITGRITYRWIPREKLIISFSAARDLEAREDIFDNYAVAQTLSFTPQWIISDKTSAQLNVVRRKRENQGGLFGPLAPDRDDLTTNVNASFKWKPVEKMDVDLSLMNLDRSADQALDEYSAQTSTISVTYAF